MTVPRGRIAPAFSSPSGSTSPTPSRLPWRALIVLAAAMFISQTLEFLPGGLLPNIAHDLDRSLTAVGQLVTVFAGAVVLTSAPLSLLTRRLCRRSLLLWSLAGISLTAVAASLAPTYPLLLLTRLSGGVFHGAFWTVAGAYASYLVPRQLLGRAMAVTGLGGALASLVGGPLGNALGQWIGWRATFTVIAVMGLTVGLVAWRLLPPVAVPPSRRVRTGWDGSFRPVLLACVVLMIAVLGPATLGTYSIAWLNDVALLSPAVIPLYLLVGGIAGTVGLLATGAFCDRHPRASFAVAGGLSVAALAGLAIAGGAQSTGAVIAVSVVSSAAYACIPAMLQVRVMKVVAPAAKPMAAAMLTTVVNVGIAGGAATGGAVLMVTGLTALPWIAMTILAFGVALLLVVDRRGVPRQSREHVMPGDAPTTTSVAG